MKKVLIIGILSAGIGNLIFAGDTIHFNPENIVEKKVINGDTLLFSNIDEVTFYAPRQFKNRFEYWRYRRLIRNVKAAYPYAILASTKLEEVNNEMKKLKTDAQRKAYMKKVEVEIREEFEHELKKLTITQGKILIKLIDRETGNTSYDLVKELRGNFSAIFWQTLARLFGSNLKTEFDAEGDDKLINEIVILIENGQI